MIVEVIILGLAVLGAGGLVAGAITNLTNNLLDLYQDLVEHSSRGEEAPKE